MKDMVDAIIIGGGISGLCAAYRLQQSGRKVRLLEQRNRVGGVIRSERTSGYLIEHGPNSIQARTSLLHSLIQELDLSNAQVEASDAARMRYIVRRGQLVHAPTSPTALFTSNLFGTRAKLRVMREPFVPAGDPEEDESVASFVRRRLGDEVLDYAVNPFVAGVYAGNPEKLSVKHTFPSLVDMEQTHGSIIRGQIETRRNASELTDTGRMFSFRNGIGQLTEALAGRLKGVKTDHTVQGAELSDEGWKVTSSQGDFHARAVIYAAPLHQIHDMKLPDRKLTSILGNVTYAPLSVVYHGFRRQDVRHSLDGFGALVPEVEHRFSILGTLFTSSIFPNRAPNRDILLTTFVGGMRHPDQAAMASDALHSLVRSDLTSLLGLRGEPTFLKHVFWPRAIPQYTIGYDDVINAIDRLEAEMSGLFLAGNFRDGVSVGDSAQSGNDAGVRCHSFLQS